MKNIVVCLAFVGCGFGTSGDRGNGSREATQLGVQADSGTETIGTTGDTGTVPTEPEEEISIVGVWSSDRWDPNPFPGIPEYEGQGWCSSGDPAASPEGDPLDICRAEFRSDATYSVWTKDPNSRKINGEWSTPGPVKLLLNEQEWWWVPTETGHIPEDSVKPGVQTVRFEIGWDFSGNPALKLEWCDPHTDTGDNEVCPLPDDFSGAARILSRE